MKTRCLPLSAPHIRGNAWKYVRSCLDTEWVSSTGSFVGAFERSLAACTGSPYAVAGVNGTSCLHVALRTLGVGPGHAVAVPAVTFIATANAVSYCGAACAFIDCDPVRFNMDLDGLEDYIENRCRRKGGRLRTPSGRTLKAVLPVHVLGFPLDMGRLMRLARRHGLLVVEDAAESIGSFWAGRHTGTFGDAGVLSFNGNKIITCGGGGAVLTRSPGLARRLRHVTQQAKADDSEYFHDEIGFNYRLTNLQAALGVSQVELLPGFLQKRARIAEWYRAALPRVPAERVPGPAVWNRWLLSVQVPDAGEKARLLKRLNEASCQSRPLWLPVPLQEAYPGRGAARIPIARHAYATVVNIPSSTCLTESDVDRVCSLLRKSPLTRLLA